MIGKSLLPPLFLAHLVMGCSIGMDSFSPSLGGGSAILEPSTALRFDVVPVTGVYSEAVLLVVPTEDLSVEIIDVWVDGPDSNAFNVDDIILPILIAPDQDAELTVVFSAGHTGSHGATIYVLLSDVEGEALSVRAEGMGCKDSNADLECDPN
jgi:hypothetical protein